MPPADAQKAHDLISTFFEKGRSRTCSRREVIIGYDNEPEYAYLILSGKVKVSSYAASGRERIYHIYKEGELIPLSFIFENIFRGVIYIAHTDVVLRQRTISDTRLFFSAESIALLAVVYQELSVYDRLINLNLESAEERVAHRLLSIAERFGKRENEKVVLDFALTIKDIGDSIQLSRESTGQIIKKLEKEGMIVMGRHHLIVYPEKLCRVLKES